MRVPTHRFGQELFAQIPQEELELSDVGSKKMAALLAPPASKADL